MSCAVTPTPHAADCKETAWIYQGDHPVADAIDRRVFELLRIDRASYLDEPLQVVHYDPGAHYMCHWDLLAGPSGTVGAPDTAPDVSWLPAGGYWWSNR